MKENENNINVESDQYQNNVIDDSLLDEQPKGNGIIKFFIFLIIVSVCGALGWYFYKSYNKKNYNEVVIVSADQDEIKAEPTDPGGMIVNNMDKDVYDTLDSNQKKIAKAEVLLPPSEEPINKKELLLSEMALDIKKPEEDLNKSDEQMPVEEKLPVPVAPVVVEPVVENASPVVIETKTVDPIKQPEVIVAQQPEQYIQPITKKEVKTKPNFTKKSDKFFKVQIASFKSVIEAEREWKNMLKKYKILNGFDYYIVSKEIEGKGIFYRLQVGSFEKDSEAKKTCRQFKDLGINCFVIKP